MSFHSTIKTIVDKGHPHYDSINRNDDVGVNESKTLEDGLGEKDFHSFVDVKNRPSSRALKGICILLVPLVIAGGLFASHNKTPLMNISETSAALTSSSSLAFGPSILEVETSLRCVDDQGCSGLYPYCLKEGKEKPDGDSPRTGFCYECIIDVHCGNKVCKQKSSNLYCDQPNVAQMPGIGQVEHLYNIFTGDPLHIVSFIDHGFTTKKFYQQQFNDTDPYSFQVQNEVRYRPEEITVRALGTSSTITETTSLSSTSAYKKEVKKSVSYRPSLTLLDHKFEAVAGTSTYEQVSTNASFKQTTVVLNQAFNLYSFDLKEDADLVMTEEADVALKKLSNVYIKWEKFFDEFGTHVIDGGVMGSFVRTGFVFTEEQREELESYNESFDRSVAFNLPAFVGFKAEKKSEPKTEEARSISKMLSNSWVFTQGDIEEPLRDPGLISRSLTPVCKKINVNKYPNIEESDCFANMEKYCIAKLTEAGLSNSECAYPVDKNFDCVTNTDCDNKQVCSQGTCVECEQDDDCADKFVCKGGNKCVFDIDSEFREVGPGSCRPTYYTKPKESNENSAEACADRCRKVSNFFAFDFGHDRCRCFLTEDRRRQPFPLKLSNEIGYTCYMPKQNPCGNFECKKEEFSPCDWSPKCPSGYEELEETYCSPVANRLTCNKWVQCEYHTNYYGNIARLVGYHTGVCI